MMNNNDNKDIKFTGDPVAFDGVEGKRDPKVGKGRFDLIPTEVYHPLFKKAESNWFVDCHPAAIMQNIADEKFIDAIIQMTIYAYSDHIENNAIQSSAFWTYVWPMLLDLAIHFQKGAEHYGERNCQNGIPLWSFKDSAMRHAAQTFEGKEDEPHKISVIWNLWMAQWTVIQERRKIADAISGPPTTLYEINKDWFNLPTNKEQTPREKAKAFMADYLGELKADLTAIIKSLKDNRKDLMSQQFKYTSDSMEYININQSVADLRRIIKGLQCVADHVGIPIVTAQQTSYTSEADKAIEDFLNDKSPENIDRIIRKIGSQVIIDRLKTIPLSERQLFDKQFADLLSTPEGKQRARWFYGPDDLFKDLIERVEKKAGFDQDYRDYLPLLAKLNTVYGEYLHEKNDSRDILPPSASEKYVLVQDKYAELRDEIKQENSVTEEAPDPAKDTAMEEFNKAIAEGPVERLLGELTEELSHELRLCQSSPTFANAWQFVHKYRESLNKMLEVWNQIAAAAYDPKLGDKHSDDK